MRKYINTIRTGLLFSVVLLLSSCFKDFKDEFLFTEFMIEFDASSWESNAPGKTYPILGPVEKGSGVQLFKINLLGEQSPMDQVISYKVNPEETTAIEGVHFRLADDGQVVMKANESEAFVAVEILDFPASEGLDTLVLELEGTERVKVSKNYSKLGLAILLTGPPSTGDPLHMQLGPDQFYNSIYVDPLNLDLSADVRQRIQQSAANLAAVGDGSRNLQNMYFYFDHDDMLRVVAAYNGGGGNSLTAYAFAIWNYKMVLSETGTGTLEFVDANGNGNSQKANFAPILEEYLEQHAFRVDWYEQGTAINTTHKDRWGGLYRADDPTSYLIGSLETLNPAGSIRPFPQAQAVHDMFNDGTGGYYTGLVIDPLDETQSERFKSIWDASYTHVEGLAGRQIQKVMFYFDPASSFQDIRLVYYYLSSTGGQFNGQIRAQLKVDTEGVVHPFAFTFQNANGAAVRAPQLNDDFFFKESFKMTRSGQRVRFTQVEDPSVYFEGELGNHSLNVSDFWP